MIYLHIAGFAYEGSSAKDYFRSKHLGVPYTNHSVGVAQCIL